MGEKKTVFDDSEFDATLIPHIPTLVMDYSLSFDTRQPSSHFYISSYLESRNCSCDFFALMVAAPRDTHN